MKYPSTLPALGVLGLAATLAFPGCRRGQPEALSPVPGPPVFNDRSTYNATPGDYNGGSDLGDAGPLVPPSNPAPVPSNSGAVLPSPPQPDMTEPLAGTGSTYTVKKNDSLWKIAKEVYGNGQRWVDIRDANPGVDPKKLAVGQELILP